MSTPKSSAAEFVPASRDLDDLRHAAADCHGCGLYAPATQVVFGEGRSGVAMMLVGEQPGDREDVLGKPFVGPAGQLLDRALRAAGITREDVYITNAVKHFSFVERGKRRIHQTPKTHEVRACGPWLDAEMDAVAPRIVVALGATAAKAMLGDDFRITRDRGRVVAGPRGLPTLATAHPSAILRAEPERQEDDFAALVADLKIAVVALEALPTLEAPPAPAMTRSSEARTTVDPAPASEVTPSADVRPPTMKPTPAQPLESAEPAPAAVVSPEPDASPRTAAVQTSLFGDS